MIFVNIGCGSVFHPSWINFNFVHLHRRSVPTSRIPEYATYEFDAGAGASREPDSIYLEAKRPTGGR